MSSPWPAFRTGRVTVWTLTLRAMPDPVWRLEPDATAGIRAAAHQNVTVLIGRAQGGGTSWAAILGRTHRGSARRRLRGLAGGVQGHAHSGSSSGPSGSAGSSSSGSTHHQTLSLRNE